MISQIDLSLQQNPDDKSKSQTAQYHAVTPHRPGLDSTTAAAAAALRVASKTSMRPVSLSRRGIKSAAATQQPQQAEEPLLETRTQDPRRQTLHSADRTTRTAKGKTEEGKTGGTVSVTNESYSAAGSDFAGSPRSGQYEDGKAFFKLARKALPFDKFNQLIKNIQMLNKNQKSKEETVAAAEVLFGAEKGPLLDMLKRLLYHGGSGYQNGSQFK